MRKADTQKEKNMAAISGYLDPELVLFLSTESRNETIQALVDCLDEKGRLNDKEEFLNAIIEREKIVTTGIGMGVAIPHAKLTGYDDFFIAIAVLNQGVEWDALDKTPVRLVFMIGGPDDKQTEYLQILSGITLALKNEERRKKMINAANAEDVIKCFQGV